MFLGEKCIFFGENAWISENQEGFALENALNFRIYIYIKNAIKYIITMNASKFCPLQKNLIVIHFL